MDQGEITPDSCHPHFDYISSSSGGGNVAGNCDVNSLFEIQNHEALLKLQQMVNRYNECFSMLKDTLTAVEVLRLENLRLKSENMELEIAVQEIEKLALKNLADSFDSPINIDSGSGSEVISGSGGSGSGGSGSGSGKSSGMISSFDGSGSGTGSEVITMSNPPGSNVPVKAPKSISIRSRGYLEGNEKTSGDGSRRLRVPAPTAIQGDEKETIGEVEVEVYNQGTTKTELCNKWEREGLCPYKDRCQFAHGMEELRPVIRHPRYKTQLCRMMDASGGCPYGHRCHFRHALAPRPHDN